MYTKSADNILELVGNTPMVRLSKLTAGLKAVVWGKLESFNPGGSIKDRIALAMVEQAEQTGKLKKDGVILEATSGNTGIGLALVASVKGYRLILTMPENMSIERQRLLAALGVELILTPEEKGMAGAIGKTDELIKANPDYFRPQQFKNPANPQIHRKTTAEEIWLQAQGRVDILVAGVGTGGTITGVGEALKQKNPGLEVVAVEPELSAVLSGEKKGSHKIQGIGSGFIPEILNKNVIDKIVKVSDEQAEETSRSLMRQEGLIVGISSGAACFAALEIARSLGQNKNIVAIFPDTGERYLSEGRV